MPADQIGQRGTAAFVRHVHDVDLRCNLELLARHVKRRTHAAGTESQRARFRFRQRNQIVHRTRRQRCGNDQPVGNAHRFRHRHEILARIERPLGVEGRRHTETGIDHQQCVAVGNRLGYEVRPDDGARARTVVDNHSLSQCFRQLRSQQPRRKISRAARCVRDHQPDRPVRIIFRVLGAHRHRARNERTRHQPCLYVI